MFQVSHIFKSYRSNQVLKDVSFCAKPGDCIGLIGPNGCGKSTLLSILSGMQKPNSGEILWDEKNLLKNPRLFSDLIAYVPQANPLFDDMTGMDHLRLWYASSSYSLEEDLKDGFPAKLGVNEFLSKKVSSMSGGMKKRLSLACALSNRQPMVFFDEPAAALDLIGKEMIRNYILDLQKMDKIILLATHEEADFSICTRFLVFTNEGLKEVPSGTSAKEILSLITTSGKETL